MVEVVLLEPVQMYKDVAINTHSHNVGAKHTIGAFALFIQTCIHVSYKYTQTFFHKWKEKPYKEI